MTTIIITAAVVWMFPLLLALCGALGCWLCSPFRHWCVHHLFGSAEAPPDPRGRRSRTAPDSHA